MLEPAFKFVLPGYNVRPLEMSGAIGREQLKKLTGFIDERRSNAKIFTELFKSHPFITIQKEIGTSSWFGFAIILHEDCPISRKKVVEVLTKNNIECRPIVTGNFLKNIEVLEYFDYSVSGSVPNSEYIESYGLFEGNHQVNLNAEIKHLHSVLVELFMPFISDMNLTV